MSITAAFERALSFDRIAQRIARAVYRHDSRSADHYIRDIFVPPDTYAIVYEAMQEQYWRVDYTITEAEDVEINEHADWVQVENVWQPVTTERMTEMRAEKRDLLRLEDGPVEEPAQTRGATEAAAPAQTPGREDAASPQALRHAVPHGAADRVAQANHRQSSQDNVSTFLGMTRAVARDGLSLDPDGLDTTPFMQNPVFCFVHQKTQRRIPVGRVLSMARRRSEEPSEDGWLIRVEWYDDAFSKEVKRAYKTGFMHAVSVSWLPIEREVRLIDGRRVPVDVRAELLEFSAVGVPGDANALVVERHAGDIGDLKSLSEARVQEMIDEALETHAVNRDAADARRSGPSISADGSISAGAAPEDSDATVRSSSAPEVPAKPRVDLTTARALRRERLRRALLEANKRLGRA